MQGSAAFVYFVAPAMVYTAIATLLLACYLQMTGQDEQPYGLKAMSLSFVLYDVRFSVCCAGASASPWDPVANSMSDMYKYLDEATLRVLLEQSKRNLAISEKQVAPYGANAGPHDKLNQIEAERKKLVELEEELRRRESPSRVAQGLEALEELARRDPAINAKVAGFQHDFRAARERVVNVIALKEVHDRLHTMQFTYNVITLNIHKFPDDETIVQSFIEYREQLQRETDAIKAEFDRVNNVDVLGPRVWVPEFEAAHTTFHQALTERDVAHLDKAIRKCNQLLGAKLFEINARLIVWVQTLKLRSLVAPMRVLRDGLAGVAQDQEALLSFEHGVEALSELRNNIEEQIANHDAWQQIDRELRLINTTPRQRIDELEETWRTLQEKLTPLVVGDEPWTQELRKHAPRIDAALCAEPKYWPESDFRDCKRAIDNHFYRVDRELKKLCDRLRDLEDPLAALGRRRA